MASSHVDTLQVSSVDILVASKVELVKWLSSDLHILQHAHADGVIDDRVYRQLRDIEQRENACIKLIDTVTSKGEGTSSQFLSLLKKKEIVNAYPQLKEWNSSFALPGKSSEHPPSPRPASPASGRPRKRRKHGGTVDVQLVEIYRNQLQTNVEEPFTCVPEGSVQRTDREDFEDRYTYLRLIYVDDTEISSELELLMERKKAWQEIQQREMVVMKKSGQLIQLSFIFKHPSGKIKRVRSVMSIGNAGVGKTFLVHKFVHDWAKKKRQHPHLIFVFQFRHLNLLRGRRFSLAQLIHECIDATKFIPEERLNYIFTELQKSGNPNYDNSLFKLLFVFDGLDESTIPLDFEKNHHCSDDFSQPIPLEELLVNLLTGKVLRCAHVWTTTRPAAAKLIPSQFVDMVTEVQGFTDPQKDEYFRKWFSDDEELADRIISHMKSSKSLHTRCEIPVFCSMAATVLHDMLRRDQTGQLPSTTTEMNCRFLMVQTKRNKKKYDEAHAMNQQQLMETDREFLLKLGRLAFEHLEKGRIIFYQEDLEACGLDVKEAALYSGVCTEIFKGERVSYKKNVYSFVHLSIQEFMAAVSLFDCFTQKNTEVLEAFLGYDYNSYSSMSDFLLSAMRKALVSENGHLDLFVRFLHGLSLQSNQRLLGGLLGQTQSSPEEIQRAINNLKEMNDPDASPDRCINIFHCLMEMNDPSVSQGIQQYLESESRSGKTLSETQCSALASMLLMSEEVLEELDLDKYNTRGWMGLKRLIPAVRNCTTARLVGFGDDLNKEHIEVVASALSSNPSHLRHLDLSSNDLDDDLDLLCEALKSPNCRLETLRLMHCWLSEECCELLASALRSNPHLRELDLRFNVFPVSGLESFSGLETLKVKHGGELWTNPQLLRQYFNRLTLDPNTASRTLCLSDDNRKVTRSQGEELQPYADHRDRFSDDVGQVLCTEGLSGGRYLWEVEVRGGAGIGVSYRPISSRGEDRRLGWNDYSWSLYCDGGSYYVFHNSRDTFLPVRLSDSNRAVDEWGWPVYSGRVSVFLDCPAGTLSFYEVFSDSLRHLYTFQTTFTEPLYPGFSLTSDDSSVCLCEDR